MSIRDFSEADDSFSHEAEASFPQIPGYRVLGKIGQGGMGTVWRAEQQSTRREVALKLLSAGTLASDHAKRRFEREVELSARLEHPGIARVFDAGRHRGVCYYAMELIEGGPLDEFAAAAGLTIRGTVELIQRVCEAVRHAHQRGVIHRDLKPANILVTPDGQPHVLDFGLAKTTGDEEAAGLTMTREGIAAGTPAYMSPEQAGGESHRIDTRTDVYALGVNLYRMLTHDHPHDLSGSRFDVMRRIAQSDIRRPRRVRGEIDGDLEAILVKALARDVKERYSTAGDLADDIARYLRGDAVLAHALTLRYILLTRARRHRAAIALAALVLAVVIGITVLAFVNITLERNESRRLLGLSIAAEAKANASDQAARRRLASGKLSEGSALALATPPDWRAAIERYNESIRINRGLGEPTIEASIGLWAAFRASPPSLLTIRLGGRATCIAALDDGRSVVIGIGSELRVYDLATGLLRRRIAGPGGAVTALAVDPAGALVAAGDSAGGIALFNLADGARTASLAGHKAAISWLLFTRGGRELLSATFAGPVHRHDTSTGQVIRCVEVEVIHDPEETHITRIAPFPENPQRPEDALVLLTTQSNCGEVWDAGLTAMKHRFMMGVFGHGVPAALVSDNGRLIITPEHDRVNVRRFADGVVDFAYFGQGGPATSVALGPDGDHFITGGQDNMVRVFDLRWKELDQVYTEHTAPVRGVCGLRRGGRPVPVVASISDDQTCKVWTFNELDRLFSVYPNHLNIARFSRDGRMVLIVQSESAQPLLMDVATGQPLRVFRRPSGSIDAAAIAPDSRTVAFEVDNGKLELWDVESGQILARPAAHANDVIAMEYSPDGRSVVTGDEDSCLRWWNVTPTGWTKAWEARVPLATEGQGTSRPPLGVGSLAFLPSGVAAGMNDGRIVHYSADGKTILANVQSHTAAIRAMALCPDGRHLLAGGSDYDSALRMWDTRPANPGGPWTLSHTFEGHFRKTQSIAVSPDGRYAFSGDEDSLLILWDLVEGRRVRSFRHHGSGYSGMQVRADDGPWPRDDSRKEGAIQLLLTGPYGGAVSRWNFGAPARMVQPPVAALTRLEADARDAEALKELGQWHLERGLRHWGIALLEDAREAGAAVDGLSLARAKWCTPIDDAAGALAELDRVRGGDDDERYYLTLLRSSLLEEASQSSKAATGLR
jgi:serine/threonine protein kinase/WD40 repeat protein